MEKVKCRGWDDLLAHLDGLDGWIFRGHASANWPLASTLERRAPAEDRRLHIESQLVREFRRRAHNYLGPHDLPTSDGEWLALMQHFGAPTRLLDFTWSPFVATYFAFEDLPSDSCAECAIFAVSPAWCHHCLGRLAFEKGGLFGIDLDDLEVGMKAVMAGPSRFSMEGREEMVAGGLLSGFVERNALASAHPMAAVLDLERLSERMSAQQGVFLWPGDVDLSLVQNLEAFGDSKENVKQFVVSLDQRGRALEQLRLMNITRTSLFPGLEGYAQSFRQLPVREPSESRNIRAALRGLKMARDPNGADR